MLDSKIRAGNATDALVFKKMDVLLHHAEDNKDMKLIILDTIKFIENRVRVDDRCIDKLKKYIETKYPHMKDTIDKLLLLK